MKKIYYHHELVGILITSINLGSNPITDPKEPLQLVTLKHKKGAYLKAHLHMAKKRVTESLQECLIVRKGKIRIDLYTKSKSHFNSLEVTTGEVFLLLSGGYGIHMLEDSELIEFKNGPFIEDKVLIQAVSPAQK